MALHQIALTKAHLCAWKGRGGGGAGPELLLGSLAWSEEAQHNLPSKTGKIFLALLPAGQGTLPLWACWQWHPKESSETAKAQGSGCSKHPWLGCGTMHALSRAEQSRHSHEGTTSNCFCSHGSCHPSPKPRGDCRKMSEPGFEAPLGKLSWCPPQLPQHKADKEEKS